VQRFRKAAVISIIMLGSAAFVGCGGEDSVYYAGVTVGPPAPLVYGPVGVAPGAGYVWTDGYYNWAGGSWRWTSGRWSRPPHPGYVWRKPYYESYHKGYRYHPGHWSHH